jgi:hypothetical protein
LVIRDVDGVDTALQVCIHLVEQMVNVKSLRGAYFRRDYKLATLK